jgi:hypothetical protein
MSAPAPTANPSLASRLADLHTLLDSYVSAPTRHDDLDIVLAAVYAVHLGIADGRPPFWVLFVDPPASGKTAIQELACEHVRALFEEKPRAVISPACDVYLQTLAEYVRLGRTPILKDEDGARVLGVPEEPFRVYQQLRLAMEALAVVRGHSEVMAADLEVIRRLALSSILHRRYEAMRALEQTSDLTLTPAIAHAALRLSESQAHLWLTDLVDVGLLQKDGVGRYVPAPEFQGLMRGDGLGKGSD